MPYTLTGLMNHMYNCSFMQITNYAAKHSIRACKYESRASVYDHIKYQNIVRQHGWSISRVADMLLQKSLGFIQNGTNKCPVSGRSVVGNTLLMSERTDSQMAYTDTKATVATPISSLYDVVSRKYPRKHNF